MDQEGYSRYNLPACSKTLSDNVKYKQFQSCELYHNTRLRLGWSSVLYTHDDPYTQLQYGNYYVPRVRTAKQATIHGAVATITPSAAQYVPVTIEYKLMCVPINSYPADSMRFDVLYVSMSLPVQHYWIITCTR